MSSFIGCQASRSWILSNYKTVKGESSRLQSVNLSELKPTHIHKCTFGTNHAVAQVLKWVEQLCKVSWASLGSCKACALPCCWQLQVTKNIPDFYILLFNKHVFSDSTSIYLVLTVRYHNSTHSLICLLCLCIHLYPHSLSLHLCSVGCRPSCPQCCCSAMRLMVAPPSKATKPLSYWLSTRAFTLIGWLAGVL